MGQKFLNVSETYAARTAETSRKRDIAHKCGTFLFPHGGGMQMDAFKHAKASGELPSTVGIQDTTDACQMHALRQTSVVHVITGFTHVDGLDAERISRSILEGRRMAFTVAEVARVPAPRRRWRRERARLPARFPSGPCKRNCGGSGSCFERLLRLM